MNKVIVMGNLGQDPDVRFMPSGQAVVQISVATNRSWKDKDSGDKKEEVSWHRCVGYGNTAENIGKFFKKGRKILIEGRLKYGSYDKDGIKHYTTDVVIERFEFVESGGGNRPPHPAEQAASSEQTTSAPAKQGDIDDMPPTPPPPAEFDDDIPF